MARPLTATRLARWLGPWSDPDESPTGVETEETSAGGARVRWFRSTRTRATGTVVIMPGLHYAGPDDPRFDRLARVFAHAGSVVAAPFLTDYLALRVTPAVFDQVDAAFEHILETPGRPPRAPSIFSISFGSLPSFHIAAGPFGDRIGALTIFGGYANWERAARFALTGIDGDGPPIPADPLNRPVVLTNLLDEIPDMREHADVLRPQWREFCAATWGRPEMKERARFDAVARELARSLPVESREYFLMGCGAVEGGVELAEAALASGDWSHLDPTENIRGIRCPVHVIHGVDDDVIPHSQLAEIRAALPPDATAHTYLTGMYSHTGTAGEGHSPLEKARELWTMVRMLGALSS